MSTNVKKNWVEWTVFALGLVLVLAVLGYLGYAAFTGGGGMPHLEARLGAPHRQAAGGDSSFVVPVTVVNHSERTAEAVRVEVTLDTGGASKRTERALLVLSFVPPQSQRSGAVTFTQDPRRGRLRTRVLGFVTP